MAAAALAALPLAKAGAEKVLEFANTPVWGYQRIETYRKGKKDVSERSGFQVRAWEIGLAALVAWIALGGLEHMTTNMAQSLQEAASAKNPWSLAAFMTDPLWVLQHPGEPLPKQQMGTVGDVFSRGPWWYKS